MTRKSFQRCLKASSAASWPSSFLAARLREGLRQPECSPPPPRASSARRLTPPTPYPDARRLELSSRRQGRPPYELLSPRARLLGAVAGARPRPAEVAARPPGGNCAAVVRISGARSSHGRAEVACDAAGRPQASWSGLVSAVPVMDAPESSVPAWWRAQRGCGGRRGWKSRSRPDQRG